MGARKKVTRHFADSARELLQLELDAKEIAYRTFITYRAAVNKFEEVMGKLSIQEISPDQVLDFKRKIVLLGKENMANQYIRKAFTQAKPGKITLTKHEHLSRTAYRVLMVPNYGTG